ncbi:serine hydrolase [Clostridiaceae bacterium M8S5]|nr:serine hydrolase [Clostridiaceae bacterium M8S5]
MTKTTINSRVDALIKEKEFSGVVSIRKQGKIIYETAAGYRDRSNKIKNNINTKFGIASGTKTFTALAIGKLIEQGKISLDTKLFDIIKYDFKLYSKDVTIRDLLTHTSGIPDYLDESVIEDFNNFFLDIPWYKLKEPKDYFPLFPDETMKFTTGEKFAYNNSGFVLLAAIIAEVSGMSYSEYVKKHIFEAIGMKDSGFYAMNRLPENTAIGYIKDDEGWRTNVYNLPIVGGGDGGAFTTIVDIYKLWDALLSYQILSKELTELYVKPHIRTKPEGKTYYGHGIWIYKDDDITEEYMEGCDAGVSFKSAIVRDKDIIYTVISNTEDGAWPILREISSLQF